MSTAPSNYSADFGSAQQLFTVADLADTVGGIPLSRICFSPLPGTATQADLYQLNEVEGKHYELIHGTLVEKAMGTWEGFLAGWIATKFNNYLDTNEIGAGFGDNVPLVFAPKLIYIPDAGFISTSRLPGGEFPTEKPFAEIIPNLAVEVISTSNTKPEMDRKLASYFECGVEEVWFVFPKPMQVMVFLPGREPLTLGIGDALTTALLPGFTLPVKTLFSPPGRRLK